MTARAAVSWGKMTGVATSSSDSIPIELDGYVATISAPRDLGQTIRAAFADVVRTSGAKLGANVVVTGTHTDAAITVDGRRWAAGEVDAMIDRLTYVLLRASLDSDVQRLHLHAGLVAKAGGGVLIAGFPGSGKSTLVALLVEAGFDYLTEERVAIDSEGHLSGLPKPISVVAGSFQSLSQYDPATTGKGATSDRLWHIPATAIRSGSVVKHASPRVIAFAEYHERAPLDVTEVHPAEAVRLLLADSPDARRFGPAALTLVAELCASVRCVRIRYGNSADAQRAIEQQLENRMDRQTQISPLQINHSNSRTNGSEPADKHTVLSPEPGLTGVAIGDRSIVTRTTDSEVIEIDQTSAMWLQLIDGSTELSVIVREVADANDLSIAAVESVAYLVIERLISSGLIR